MSGDATSTRIGGFQPLAGKSWSKNVGALANAARACYRVVNDALLFENIGDQVHTLAESDGSFNRDAFKGERTRLAVNDVTVCGKEEPQAYVTEIFEGDGITSVYQLSEVPLMEKATLLFDTFYQQRGGYAELGGCRRRWSHLAHESRADAGRRARCRRRQ